MRGTSARHGSRVARARSSRRRVAARASSEARAEQHDQVAGRQLLAELVGEDGEVDDREAALPRQVGRRDQPAQRRPAGPPAAQPIHGGAVGAGQERHPRQPAHDRVAVAAAADRGAGRNGGGPPRLGRVVGELDPEHRPDARGVAGAGELHRAVGAVAVGEGEGVHLLLGGPLDQRLRVRGAVAQGVARGDVQVHERVGHGVVVLSAHAAYGVQGGDGQDRAASGRAAPARATARSRPGTGRRRGPGRRPRAR